MDYDDNDFQGQNLQLAGEGSTKFPPVLRPYALPKFDFDDSLQGHLRFDSLVETEVFLGIESQEDNQWIEEFSRASSGIEFSPSAAESCSISRHNNVWSEATSSESVEMLLKSVGQEEMIPGQAVIEDSDAYDELGNLTKQMEPSLKQDDNVLPKMVNVMDSMPSVAPDEYVGSCTGLGEDTGAKLSQAVDVLQAHEGEKSACRSLSVLDQHTVGDKCDLPVSNDNLLEDIKTKDADQKDDDTSVHETFDKTRQDLFAAGMQLDNISSSAQNIINESTSHVNDGTNENADGLQNIINESTSHINDGTNENADGLQQKNFERMEEHDVFVDKVSMDDQFVEDNVVENGMNSSKSTLCTVLRADSMLEGNLIETESNNLREPSRVKGESDQLIAEGCRENVCPILPIQACQSNASGLSEDKCRDDHYEENTIEGSSMALEGGSAEGCDHEISCRKTGICADTKQKMDSGVHCSPSGVVEEMGGLFEIGPQMENKIPGRNSEASLLSVEDNKLLKGQGDERGCSPHVGDDHGLAFVSSSVKLLGETHEIGSIKDLQNSFGIHREKLNAGDHVLSPFLDDSVPTCEKTLVFRQNDAHNCDGNVSVIEEGNARLPTGVSDVEYEAVGSVIIDKRTGPSSSDVSAEDEMKIVKPESDAHKGHVPASDVALEDANLAPQGKLDCVPLHSCGVINDKVTSPEENEQLPLGPSSLDGKEDSAIKISIEASLLTPECSQVNDLLESDSQCEKVALSDTLGQLPHETGDQPRSVVVAFNTESQSEHEAAVNKVSQDYSESEVCPVPCDMTVKDDDGARAAILETNMESTIKASNEEECIEVSDPKLDSSKSETVTVLSPELCGHDSGQGGHKDNDTALASRYGDSGQLSIPSCEGETLNVHEGSSSPVCLSEYDAKVSALEGRNSLVESDKPSCGSPTIISCTEHSQSEKELQEEVRGPVDQKGSLCDVVNGAVNKVDSISLDTKGHDASKVDRSFTFEVSPLADLSEKETGKGWQPFSTTQLGRVCGSSSTSSLSVVDSKMAQGISGESPLVSDGQIVHSLSKSTPERKTRRASGKGAGKEPAKKVNHAKDATPGRLTERGDKSCHVSPAPPGVGQIVQSEGMQHSGNVERIAAKPGGVLPTLSSNLPDLNASASPSAVFQQPFTDLQQVQLRAQIFVYGSLIQRIAPDEVCMMSAFGGSDGGRSLWESAWRTIIERLHGQKSMSNDTETPLKSRSGARPDHTSKQGSHQSKVVSSPVGRVSTKGTPSTIVNSTVALSSPLWSMSAPSCDGMQQSGALLRGAVLDYHQALSPLHAYQTPTLRNFAGHTSSWPTQSPFPIPWVASQQTSALDASAHFPTLPITETVRLTPVRELSAPQSSGIKQISPSPLVHSGASGSVFAGASPLIDTKNNKRAAASPSQHHSDLKSRKRKKIPVSEDFGQISLLSQTRTESVPAPAVTSHLSASVAVTTPVFSVSKTDASNVMTAVSPTTITECLKMGNLDLEQTIALSEETLSKIKDAKVQAEEAAAHAAAAVSHSQGIWSQMEKQKNSGLVSDVEAKLVSAAAAIAAAASIAKAAAASAKIASNAALQAKLMADEALASSGNGSQNNGISLSDGVNNMGMATPASILKGVDGASCASSIIVAAREAARRRVEAASAASKRAENLDAIVKAAELTAEAVSQAGIIVAMGDPLPLSVLVEAGPDGYWKVPQVNSEPIVKSNFENKEQFNVDCVEEGACVPPQLSEGPLDKRETQTKSYGKLSALRDTFREAIEDHMKLVEGVAGSFTTTEKEFTGQKGRKVSDSAKTIGVVPESEFGSRSASTIVENENGVGTSKENCIKEGSLVEVFKDGDGFKASWVSANVLGLKDGKAYVCYVELPSNEGLGQLKEWVALNGEGDKAPRIRIAHPLTTVQFEGTRKRRRAAMGDYAWSVGDKVDAWMQDCWREGVVTEKHKKDETTLTVHFPAQGETSVVKAWHLRPTLRWKDGEWIECSSSRENGSSTHEGDTPQEKRLKLGSTALEAEGKNKLSKNVDVLESGKPEESRLLALSASDRIFHAGKNSRDASKPNALKTTRSGLQKEGSRVIFGVPKPGKKRKFMEVSKHYVADRGSKIDEANDSVKLAKFLIPQASGSRGRIDFKEKRAAESKPKVLKSGKAQNISSRTVSQKENSTSTAASESHNGSVTDHIARIKDSVGQDEDAPGKQNMAGFGSFAHIEGSIEGPVLFSSLALPPDAPPKKASKSERMNKGKLAPSGGRLARIEEDKVFNGNSGKSTSEVVEPRRSNRRIQPTSRLLEGLQSSLIISKIPSVSHDKGHRNQRGSSRGSNHG